MKITAVCVTFGRTALLRESLACFLNQTYRDAELLILNTCPQQHLDPPYLGSVRVINLSDRPKSLGAARNIAIQAAQGDIIVTWDDDDLFLPHYLTHVGLSFVANPRAEWVRFDKTWMCLEWQIQKHFDGWANGVFFRKRAWEKVGGYADNLSVGEDRQFVGRLTSQCPGVVAELKPEEIGALYVWGNGAFHISGRGEDKVGQLSAYDRAAMDLRDRLRSRKEPSGVIDLIPKLEHDPVKIVAQYLNKTVEVEVIDTKPKDNPPVCVVELGRFGDIINILPICLHIHNTYGTPHLMVSREFAGLLDGVSYVIPRIVDLSNDRLGDALIIAKRDYKFVLQTQIWGKGYSHDRKTEAYNLDSWHMAGLQKHFHNEHWRPVFDRRDLAREKQFQAKLCDPTKPYVVVNVTKSVSSPFPAGQKVLESLRRLEPGVQVVDVSTAFAAKFYDLLTLIEEAMAVVSIDTGLLHLAMATETPVVALVNPLPWQGSAIRYHCLARYTYTQVEADPNCVARCLLGRLPMPHLPRPAMQLARAPKRTLFHVVERHDGDGPEALARKAIAQKSWDALYQRGVVPCHYWKYERDATSLGDPRPLPFLKDVIRAGLDQAGEDDLVFWTNDDNWLHPELPELLRYHVSLYGVCCSQRCEFVESKIPESRLLPPEWFARTGRRHMGRDLFAATKHWWVTHWDEIGDYILGASDFDLALACLVRLEWGIESNRVNLEETYWPAELPRGYVAHQYHPPRWNQPGHSDTDPSQVWNRKLFKQWAKSRLPKLHFFPNGAI